MTAILHCRLYQLCILTAFGLLFLVSFGKGASIIGIDLGTNYMKVSLVRPGKMFEIVLNEASKRKSESMLAIDSGERFYGTNAYGAYSRKPETAFLRLRDLIGRQADHPALNHLSSHGYNYDIIPENEGRGFRISFGKGTNDEYLYRAEELLAMVLQYAKKIAEDYIEEKTPIQDCVITIPSFFNQFERQSLLESAEIAGLNVLSLVEENTAAALQHGIYKEFPNETSKYMIYNMGAASTQVSLVKFWGKPVKSSKNLTNIAVIAKSWDTTLGGDEFDKIIAEYIVDKFDGDNDLSKENSIRKVPRAMARIRKQAQKTKEVLSANDEIPITIESLYLDKDFHGKVSRSWLEEKAEGLLDRVTKPIEMALSQAGLKPEELDAVELIGGSVRIPKVKTLLKEYLGDIELGNHLNGDEAMALGAVFMGANLSKAFRVRNVGLTDIITTPVGVHLEDMDKSSAGDAKWQKHALLFPKNSPLHSRKVVTFHHEKEISCVLRDETNEENVVPFARYDVTGVTKASSTYGHLGKPKISISFALNLNGTVELIKAEASFVEIMQEEPEELEENRTTINNTSSSQNESIPETSESNEKTNEEDEIERTDGTSFSSGREDPESASSSKASENSGLDNRNSDSDESGENSTYTSVDRNETKDPINKKRLKKTHRVPLKVHRSYDNIPFKLMSNEEKQQAKALLERFRRIEEERKLHEREKNELESFIFSCRDRLRSADEEVNKVAKPNEVTVLFDDLESVEDWLYEEGKDADIGVYKEKRLDLSNRVNSIFTRINEMTQRPLTVAAAKSLVETLEKRLSNWTIERPWILEKEIKAFEEASKEFLDWLQASLAEQDKLKLSDEPALTTSNILQKLESLQTMVEQLLKRKIPRQLQDSKENENSTSSESDDSSNAKNGTTSNENEKDESDASNIQQDNTEHDEL